MKRIKQWLLGLFRFGFESTVTELNYDISPKLKRVKTRVSLIDAEGNKCVLEIHPYIHGVAQVKGVNAYSYALLVNNVKILALKPTKAGGITTGLIPSGGEHTIKCKSYEWSDFDKAKEFISIA